MSSIGIQNPIVGGPQNLKIFGFSSPLGGGIPGFIPQPTVDTDNNNEYSQTRFTLRNAWNTRYTGLTNSRQIAVSPFRAVTNSGDILSRENYSCGGPCQSFQSRPGMYGLKTHFGAIQSKCDASGIPPASCNVKYVYDGSDYTTYLKQKAINKNYNDLSNGGNDNSGGQIAWRAIRRY
jgi:hypothetical protein